MRDGQHCSIVKCLLEASGCWKRVDIKSNFYIEKVHTAEVPWLEWIGEQFYINLWPENIFGLAVDGDLCEVPHICAWNAVLIESMFYPFPDHNTAFPRLLCDSGTGPGTCFTPKNPDQSPPPIRPHWTPVYIPTIPQYIDACLSRHLLLAHLPDAPWFLGVSDLDISYLIWYLFLEHGAQWEKLLPKLHRQRREVMKDILDHYKRTVKGNINMWRDSKGMLTSRPPKARIDDTNWRNWCVDLYFFWGEGLGFLAKIHTSICWTIKQHQCLFHSCPAYLHPPGLLQVFSSTGCIANATFRLQIYMWSCHVFRLHLLLWHHEQTELVIRFPYMIIYLDSNLPTCRVKWFLSSHFNTTPRCE